MVEKQDPNQYDMARELHILEASDTGRMERQRIRNNVRSLLRQAGAFRVNELLRNLGNCVSFEVFAVLDEMVQHKEVIRLERPGVDGQHEVYTAAWPHQKGELIHTPPVPV